MWFGPLVDMGLQRTKKWNFPVPVPQTHSKGPNWASDFKNTPHMKIGGGPYLCISVCQSKEVFGVRGCIRIWNSAGMPWKRFCTGFWQKGKSTTKEYFWKDIPGRSSGLDEIQLHLLLVGEGQETSSSNLITSISWNEFQNLIFLGSLWWEEIMQRRGQQPLCGSLKCPQRLWGSQKVWEWTL